MTPLPQIHIGLLFLILSPYLCFILFFLMAFHFSVVIGQIEKKIMLFHFWYQQSGWKQFNNLDFFHTANWLAQNYKKQKQKTKIKQKHAHIGVEDNELENNTAFF